MIRIHTSDGQVFRVDGDRWTEPPLGVLKNAEIEIKAGDADNVRDGLAKSREGGLPYVYGRDWEYSPVPVSLFVTVWQGSRKVAQFDPGIVQAVGFEEDFELLEPDE